MTSQVVAGRKTCDYLPCGIMKIIEANRRKKRIEEITDFEAGAGDGTRTRDNLLGRQELYHLSYSRKFKFILV